MDTETNLRNQLGSVNLRIDAALHSIDEWFLYADRATIGNEQCIIVPAKWLRELYEDLLGRKLSHD